jgi:hypothetical protein
MLLYLPWNSQKSRVINCKLNNYNKELLLISNWVIKNYPSLCETTHIWYNDLNPEMKNLFLNISKNKKIKDMFQNFLGNDYIIDIIHDMNEIYVSPLINNNKKLFNNFLYARHISGPFFYMPFASCYSIIIGIDDNKELMTVFNLTSEKYIIKSGDVVGYDFHRECHYTTPIIWYNDKIDTQNMTNKYNIILKVHYCAYPYWAFIFGFILSKLSIIYNNLCIINSHNKYMKNCGTKLRLLFSKIYHDIEYYIGNNNICYILLLMYISSKTDYNVFLFCSSFIHYLRWIDTVDNFGEINNILRRDYYFYKFVYMLQFIYMYLSYKIDDISALYTIIITPILFVLSIYNYTICIPKLIEIYIVYDMSNNIKIKYNEYIYIYINVFLNYIQLYKPLDM